MTEEERKAFEIILAEVRSAFEHAPPMSFEGELREAGEKLCAAGAMLTVEMQLRIGNEVLKIILARAGTAGTIARLKSRDTD